MTSDSKTITSHAQLADIPHITKQQARGVLRIAEKAAEIGNTTPFGEGFSLTITEYPSFVYVYVRANAMPRNTVGGQFSGAAGGFTVGRLGGIKAITPEEGRKTKARRAPLIYGFISCPCYCV